MVNDRANRQKSEIWDAHIRGVVQLIKAEQPTDAVASLLRAKATEGESSLDLEPVVYQPVKFTPDSHPHFSHVWYARHVLNAESPLVKRELRDMIERDGKWDEGRSAKASYDSVFFSFCIPLTQKYSSRCRFQ